MKQFVFDGQSYCKLWYVDCNMLEGIDLIHFYNCDDGCD